MISKLFSKKMANSRIAMVLVAIVGFVAEATIAPAPANAEEIVASIVRGGRLYDNWFVEVRDRPPTIRHPAYPPDGKYAQDPGATWRCTECHGWDYLGKDGAYSEGPHFTGIKGIDGMAGADPSSITAVLKGDTHAFVEFLDERDFRDLANFVSQGQTDMDRLIDRDSRQVKADKTIRESYYTSICGNCHGSAGQRFRGIPTLAETANTNPWKALHTVVNGHPGENMPALRVFGSQVLAEIVAYVQTLPDEPLVSSIARGGRLYDNWYLENGRQPPETRHPAYSAKWRYAYVPKINWRCRECHGWDYLGKDGAYSEGPHFTGIKGIRGMDGADPEDIVTLLQDETHQYAGPLEDRDIGDLANFVSQGQVNMDRLIDRASRRAKGNKFARKAYFDTICASCHGQDGRKITTMVPLGRVVTRNPWKALHMIMNGHPDEEMPALRVLVDTQELADVLAYAQTLPVTR